MDDCLRQSLDDGGLTNAGFTDQNRIVLGATREDLHDALHLDTTTNHRVELVIASSLGQVAAELLQNRRVLAFVRGGPANARADRFASFTFAALVSAE
ncbi:Protein of uncharacterised function (DUF3170) [Chlamydia trachomatis]|nr:Protein of uncharacterised function (DUF3170) [Chlamydia trachomatis]